MNKDVIKGNWKQLKGMAQKRWGELTDDELNTFGTRAVARVPRLQRLLHYICRNGFERLYNIPERVVPEKILHAEPPGERVQQPPLRRCADDQLILVLPVELDPALGRPGVQRPVVRVGPEELCLVGGDRCRPAAHPAPQSRSR